jgi:hypothetical protein
MFFFGVSAGGVKRCSTTEKIQGAVLLHFFNEFFFVFLLEASSSAAAADSSDSEAEARKIFHDQWNRQC